MLGESVHSASTIVARRDNLVALLATAGGTVDTVNTLFARNPDAGKELVVGVDQVFGSFADDPEALPYTRSQFNSGVAQPRRNFPVGTRASRWSGRWTCR